MAEPIPAFDYARELAGFRDEINLALARVLDSGSLILGPEVAAFEREVAEKLGVDYAIGVASGTDALILTLRALGIQAGDEVVTVANTAVPTVSAIRAIGAMPRFVDIVPDTLQMSAESLNRALSDSVSSGKSKVRCIIPVHLHGCPADVQEILSIADGFGLPIIGDCAQAHGAEIDQRSVGSFGNASCYSFYPTKNIGAFGDGGLCVTNSEIIATRIRELRQYGFRGDRVAHSEGVCSRLDELQAAMLRVRLKHFDEAQCARRRIAGRYIELLKDTAVELPVSLPGSTHAWHQFVIRTPQREQLVARLTQARIGFGIHYPMPIHLMPAYEFLGYRHGDLPHTESAAGAILSLPMFPGLRDDEIDRVVEVIRSL